MKKIISIAISLVCTFAYAFENENSALNFAWDYAKKDKDAKEHGGPRIGIMEKSVDTIINTAIYVLDPEEPIIESDTIIVPKGHYVVGIEKNDHSVGGGCEPYTLLFLSKSDSSYSVVDACGNFIDGYHCTVPFYNMLTRQNAIDSLITNLDSLIGNKSCNVYLFEGNRTLDSDTMKFTPYWHFYIQTKTDTITVDYAKDLSFYDLASYFVNLTPEIDSLNGYSLVYSRQKDAVKDMGSNPEFDVYPNPVSNFITVPLSNCTMNLCSIVGQSLKKSNSSVMDMSEFPAGLYLLKIKTDNHTAVKRIIKD